MKANFKTTKVDFVIKYLFHCILNIIFFLFICFLVNNAKVNAQINLSLISSHALTPNETDEGGVFARIYYHTSRNKFYLVYAARPIGSTAPAGVMSNFSWREYDADMNFTGNKGILSGFSSTGDYAMVMVDNAYYHLTLASPTANYILTKFNDDFVSQGSKTITLNSCSSNIDQLMNYVNGRLIIGAMYDGGICPPVNPPSLSLLPNSEILQYDLNLNSLASSIITSPSKITWGGSMVYNGGYYYEVTMDNCTNRDLYAYKYDVNFNYIGSTLLSSDGQWSQGVIFDNGYYYVAHHTGDHNRGNIVLSMYDENWSLVATTNVTEYTVLTKPGISYNANRPFIQKLGNKIYVSYDVESYDFPVNQLDWQANLKVYQTNNMDDGALISMDNPVSPFASGSHTVKVTLMNKGSSTISSAQINWTVNGASQTAYTWSGSLSPGSSTSISLGNYDFKVGSGYTVQTSLSSINGSADSDNSNDILTSSTLYPACSGSYTVGSSSDFSSLNTAISYLQAYGLLGPVTLNIKTATYTEQVNIPLILGISATNTLTIQSQSGLNTDVILSYSSSGSSNNYVVQLDGANYVTLQNVSIRNTGSSYCTVVNFKNGANYNTINNCMISGSYSSGTSTSTNYALIYCTSSTLNQHNQITNNSIQNGSYGICYFGNSSSSMGSGINLSNNTISSISSKAIWVKNLDAPVISQNNINGKTSTSFYGLCLQNLKNGSKIEKNKITGGYGIGMYIASLEGTSSSYTLIDNNFIQIAYGRGIYLSSSCSFIKFYYNSINLTASSQSKHVPFQFGADASNLKFYNNIFANSAGGYALYSSSGISVNSSAFDYNDYYTSGSKLMYWTGTAKTNLTSWQTATAYDSHSISTNPNFVSSTDLHVSASALNNKGIVVSEVNSDIDGNSRSSSAPDIGADEFSLSAITEILSTEQEKGQKSEINLHPNPVSDRVFIDILITEEDEMKLIILDISGKQVDKIYSGKLLSGKYTFSYDVNRLADGIYFIVCKTHSQLFQKQLVVSKK